MDRDVTSGHGRRVLFHNLFSHEKTPSEQIIEDFRRNAEYLRQRKNGNALYHEILSFSTGYRVQVDALVRAIADIGQEYLNQRAPDQLGYGVVHLDKDHAHLHLCISANRADAPDRVRLAKAEFAKVQQRIEAIVLERYPELAQGKVYDKERQAERIKSRRAEQEMRRHRGVASDKEQLTQRLHAIFELAQSADGRQQHLRCIGQRSFQGIADAVIRSVDVAQPVRLIHDDQVPARGHQLFGMLGRELVRADHHHVLLERPTLSRLLVLVVASGLKDGRRQEELVRHFLRPLLAKVRRRDDQDAALFFRPLLSQDKAGLDGLSESDFVGQDRPFR